MAKRLFNFYLDDELRDAANSKIVSLTGDQPKGQLAALIRVLLKQFVMTTNVNPLLVQAIAAEYEYSQSLNKRSKL